MELDGRVKVVVVGGASAGMSHLITSIVERGICVVSEATEEELRGYEADAMFLDEMDLLREELGPIEIESKPRRSRGKGKKRKDWEF